MPSASTTADSKASSDPTDAIKQAVQLVEKKIRNLEKRKQKLDGTREKLKSGDIELNADQKEAINRINVVEGNLELARDLRSQFLQLQTDQEKLWVKQQKRERRERQVAEMERFQALLIVNEVLNAMGDETVREDFRQGNNGAVKLSEEDLSRLDELHQLITPEREEEAPFTDKLKVSSDHIVSLLDGKDKEVIGTTYKQLKALTDSIYECSYWSKSEQEAESVLPEDTPIENGETVPETETPEAEYVDADDGLTPAADMPGADQQTPGEVLAQQQAMPSGEQRQMMAGQTTDEAGLYEQTRTRNFSDIVSSVQGNYNFLQDSELEPISLGQPEAAHIDPAILHAQPRQMPNQTEPLTQGAGQTYQQFSQDSDSQPPAQSQTYYNSMVHDPVHLDASTNLNFADTPDKPEPIPMPNQTKLLVNSFGTSQPQTTSDAGVFQSFAPPEGAEDSHVTDKDQDQDDGFQSWGSRNNRGPRPGRGARGGQNGNRSGGGGGRGGGNREGGNQSRGRGGNRGGGGAWQGYPARDNYRPEGGYQGYGNQGNNNQQPGGNQGSNKRGGNANRGEGRGGRGGGFGGRGSYRGSGAPRGGRNNYQQQQQQNVQQSA